MAGDELVCGISVAVLAPAFRQQAFFLGSQHREAANFFEITARAPGNQSCALHLRAPFPRACGFHPTVRCATTIAHTTPSNPRHPWTSLPSTMISRTHPA